MGNVADKLSSPARMGLKKHIRAAQESLGPNESPLKVTKGQIDGRFTRVCLLVATTDRLLLVTVLPEHVVSMPWGSFQFSSPLLSRTAPAAAITRFTPVGWASSLTPRVALTTANGDHFDVRDLIPAFESSGFVRVLHEQNSRGTWRDAGASDAAQAATSWLRSKATQILGDEAAPSSRDKDGDLEKLERLASLRASGALSEEEFQAQKLRLLSDH